MIKSDNGLPLVLAGPILRRTSQSEIWVWLALTQKIDAPQSIELEIYDCEKGIKQTAKELKYKRQIPSAVGASYEKMKADGKVRTTTSDNLIYFSPFSNLHIYLVRAKPIEKQFSAEKLLAYEVFLVFPIDKENAEMHKFDAVRYGLFEHLYGSSDPADKRHPPVYDQGYLKSEGGNRSSRSLLSFNANLRPRPNVLPNNKSKLQLPTFIIAEPNGTARIWAGSCLKLHGDGICATKQMYSSSVQKNKETATGLLVEATKDPAKLWPHALFLLGDQIYADDVSILIFEGVSELAKLLSGEREKVPLKKSYEFLLNMTPRVRDELLHTEPANVAKLPIRLEPNVQNHLFSLSEYCAHYLMHLNAGLWPDINSTRTFVLRMGKSYANVDRKTIEEQASNLSETQKAIFDYATVLACVPVYALCDDHEVTDDWFFDQEWMNTFAIDPKFNPKKVGEAKYNGKTEITLGQSILADAIYAYGLFQGVGNDPNRFRNFAASISKSQKPHERLATLLKNDWSFVTPTTVPALFIDTRTFRHNGSSRASEISKKERRTSIHVRKAAQELIQEERTTVIDNRFDVWLTDFLRLADLIEASRVNNFLVLITPSPVLSNDSVESLKTIASEEPGIAERYLLDSEMWRTNLSNYFALVDVLLRHQIENCLVVSGDVHYGYSKIVKVSTEPSRAKSVNISQLVSSPLLNEMSSLRGGSLKIFGSKDIGSDQNYRSSIDGEVWEVAPDQLQKFSSGYYSEKFTELPQKFVSGTNSKFLTKNHFIEFSVKKSGLEKATFWSDDTTKGK